MLLHDRSIAMNIAVICFFALSFIGWISGLSLFVCCKRALIGALISYIAGGWAVKAINAVLVNAMIENQMNQQEHSPFVANRNLEDKDRHSGSAS
jgi:hypothetical protein